MSGNKNKKPEAPKPSGFDQKPNDFYRGSRGFSKPFGSPSTVRGKGFIGMRRGSR